MAAQIQIVNLSKRVITHFQTRANQWGKRWRGGLAATTGGALMVLGSLGGLPATALTDEEFNKRLELVPVFTVLREDGRPVVVFPNRRASDDSPPNPSDARVLSFLDPDDVQQFMEVLRQRNREEADKVSILVSSIGEVYQWGVANPDGPKVEYFPILDQLPEALELARAANPDLNIENFPGIPLFVATDSAGEGYLTIRKVVPFFFRLEDLNSTLEQFRRSSEQASVLDNIKVEVATLRQVMGLLRDGEDSELAERIRLIPSREALEYVQSLQQAREGSQGEATPTPAPTGAGALTP